MNKRKENWGLKLILVLFIGNLPSWGLLGLANMTPF